MPEYSDIYVISSRRSVETADRFLAEFVPQREESADEYELPQFSDNPISKFDHADEVVEHCAEDDSVEYALYWRATDGSKPEHAMVFFLADAHVIYGLSTDASNSALTKTLLKRMKAFLHSDLGYIGHEAFPDAKNLEEFKAQIRAHSGFQDSPRGA